jgi:RNA polymerase sigma factor (sigma-70 family)
MTPTSQPSSTTTDDRFTPSPPELALLTRVIRQLSCAHRLSPEDAQDFSQTVHLKLLERNYDVFQRFAGRSSLKTYLTVVVLRLLLDWRDSSFGKWRPTNAAIRLGDDAVRLERLIVRDRYSTTEAIETLLVRNGPDAAPALRDLAASLPLRPRRHLVSDEGLRNLARVEFEDPIAVNEQGETDQRIRVALISALRQLSAADRQLILLRFCRACSMKAAGELLRTEPALLYRRLYRALRALRRKLETAGVKGTRTIECRPSARNWLSTNTLDQSV